MIIKKNGTLTNYEIINICNKLNISLNQVCMKDELTDLKLGNYIINLENHNDKGSHWCCFILDYNISLYFDSFGAPPPLEVEQIIKIYYPKIYYNQEIIQDINSKLCGYYCIGLLYYIKTNPHKNLLSSADDYIKLFKDNTKLNDNILRSYFKKI